MKGRVVSHFEIVEKIGEGGNGVVWKARDLRLPRFVALKFLSPDLAGSEEAQRRLRREAEAISVLSHPHIETIYEVGESEGRLFLALEYLPGGSLHGKIRSAAGPGRQAPIRDVIACALDVAEGLAHAHRHGIIHRDIKPGNVLCTEEGAVKITDFGLAQVFDSTLSSTASFAGTIPYMSPEQVQGRPLDHRTDIYSFGAMLFEMVTGQQPFPRPNQAAVLHSIVHDPTPSLCKLRPDAPDELDRIVHRAMAKNPDKRYQRIEEISAALQRLPPEYLPLPSSQETLTVTSPTMATQTLRPFRPRRFLRKAILGGGLLLLVAVAVLVWLWPQRCLIAPNLFAACQLPEMKHIGILPFANVAGDESDRALLSGLEQTLVADLTQLAGWERTLCVHKIGSKVESSGLNLLVAGSTARLAGNLQTSVTISNPSTGLVLRRFTIQTSSSDLLSFEERFLAQMATTVGVAPHPELRSGATAIQGAYESRLRGVGYLAHNELEEAERSFRRAVEDGSHYAAAYTGLGETLHKKYVQKEDRQVLVEAFENSNEAVRLDAEGAAARSTLGQIEMELGQYAQAAQQLARSLELDPLNLDTRFRLATALEAQGQSPQAETTHRNGVRLRQDCWATHNALGSFLYAHQRYDEAEQEFLAAQKLAPESARVLGNLGGLYLAENRLGDARSLLEKSLSIERRSGPANNLANVYFSMGCYRDSVGAFKQAIDLGEVNNSRVWSGYGEALLKVPDFKGQAPDVFSRAVRLAQTELTRDSANVGVLRMLANDYAQLRDFDAAFKTIRRALELAPKDAEVQLRAALVYELAGKRDLALASVGSALALELPLERICADPGLEDLRRHPQFKLLAPGGCPPPVPQDPKGCPSAGAAARK